MVDWTYPSVAAPPCSAPPRTANSAPIWIDFFRPRASADQMMKRVPTAPPALNTPFAVAMAGVVFVAYPGSPARGKSKYEYHPGWPIVLPMTEAQYPYVC
jgi:hypothetical protein